MKKFHATSSKSIQSMRNLNLTRASSTLEKNNVFEKTYLENKKSSSTLRLKPLLQEGRSSCLNLGENTKSAMKRKQLINRYMHERGNLVQPPLKSVLNKDD